MIKTTKQLEDFLLLEDSARVARVTMVDSVLQMLKPRHVTSHQFKRFGSSHDGGYILADDITSEDVLISYGVGDNVDFEEDILKSASSAIMYDGTIDELPRKIDNAVFIKKNVLVDNFSDSFSSIVGKDLILKCDIEGGEWDILSNITTEQLSRFRQISVELHNLSNIEHLAILSLFLNRAQSTHSVVYVHPNNHIGAVLIEDRYLPLVIEVTLVRNNSYDIVDYDVPIIKSLDSPNRRDIPDLPFNLIF